jgi:glycosyltransferase involved in cell wall biosynthesis
MKRILCALPLPYGPNWGFWTRDAGLMVLTLRDMGYDAWLVALGDASTDTSNRPVLAVALGDLSRPEGWQAQRPDAVVLSTGSSPRHDAMRRAALTATPRVVERLDTDGIRSARLFPRPYFIRAMGGYLDRRPARGRWLAPIVAAARTALLYAFPRLMDVRMVKTMRQLPAVIAESPIAADRIQQMFLTFSGAKHHVAMIPHPVNENVLNYNETEKENQIISVGRWDSFQKDYPLLREVLQGFLERHPDWRGVVVGGGVPEEDRIPRDDARAWRNRLTFHAHLNHEQLAQEYNRSKIYLMVSRYESFCIAAAEALCCGCSVVGSSDVPTSYYFAEKESGRVASPRTLTTLLQALDAEVESWANGKRKPGEIAAVSRARTGSRAVCAATLALLEEILPWDSPARDPSH